MKKKQSKDTRSFADRFGKASGYRPDIVGRGNASENKHPKGVVAFGWGARPQR